MGSAAVALLLAFLNHVESDNRLRGVEQSKATGLSAPAAYQMAGFVGTRSTRPAFMLAQIPSTEPIIASTASLSISVINFEKALASMSRAATRHQGFVALLRISSPTGAARSANARLAIPAAQLDAVISEIKELGPVEQEEHDSEEVTPQVADLDIRLRNARDTEQRFAEILRSRTSKVSDILDVEREMARVQGEVESMEAQQNRLNNRVALASIEVAMTEEYEAQLANGGSNLRLRMRNAMVDGYRNAMASLLDAATFFLALGPSLTLWGGILFWPGRWAWRRWRKAHGSVVADA